MVQVPLGTIACAGLTAFACADALQLANLYARALCPRTIWMHQSDALNANDATHAVVPRCHSTNGAATQHHMMTDALPKKY